MNINLGLAQINTMLGNVEANLAKHLEVIERARAQGIDLLVFPELSLTGYGVQDLVHAVALRAEQDNPIFAPLFEASQQMDLVVGYVDEDRRHRFYIAAAYLSQGSLVHVHRKCYLPTYGLFDEGRYFAQGESVQAFETRFGRVGMLICEDYWHASLPYLLWLDGADLMVLMSAHPARGLDHGERPGSVRWIERVSQAYAGVFTVFLAHVLRAGTEDGFTFWGGSVVFDPDGEPLAQAPYIDEHLLTSVIDLNQLRRTRVRLPLLRDERTELAQRTLQRILNEHPKGR
jgi:predicted amidohydrolase